MLTFPHERYKSRCRSPLAWTLRHSCSNHCERFRFAFGYGFLARSGEFAGAKPSHDIVGTAMAAIGPALEARDALKLMPPPGESWSGSWLLRGQQTVD